MLTADLQPVSAFPGTNLVEYLAGSPFIDEINVTPWQLDADAMLAIDIASGLGLELDSSIFKSTQASPTCCNCKSCDAVDESPSNPNPTWLNGCRPSKWADTQPTAS